ncbi:glycosyltransferase [Helicobacter pylori]|uniref:glycosyltransferase n=1 Tax=Helicobacter pylori TaxID=210 RepID=UPI001F5374A2|nr:glycosyltransferase [Helicobacter pylori]
MWREENLENQLIAFFIVKNEKLLFNDQDALCFVCRGRILELPYSYNAHPSFLDTPSFPSIKEARMLHFWGDKPWKLLTFEFLLPRLSSKLLVGFLLFKIKQKVKRLVKRVF